MKKVYIYIAAMCLAALTGCIKEDPFEIKTAYLDVSIDTRSAESQQEQGDGIKDVMLWAFKCTINPETNVVSDIHETASGWRRIYDLDTYQSFTAHVQLPMCNTDVTNKNETQSYVLIAVINKDKFGTIYDRTKENTDGSYKTLTLDGGTTYSQLINASFDASAQEYWNQTVGGTQKKVVDGVEIEEETPVYMPVSHWTTFTISEENTHPYSCLSVSMPVYRAVAKSQLFMKKSSDNFDLEVYEAKLTCNKLPKEGILLSELMSNTLVSATTPEWFGNNPAEAVSGSGYPIVRPMMNASGELSDNVKDKDGKITEVGNIATIGNGTDYQFVGSTLIYETPYSCSQAADTDYSEKSVSGDGYYLEVSYRVDNQPFTKKVAIPNAVVRNHDYQIKATVDAGGKMSLTIYVNKWEEADVEEYDFQSEISASEGGMLAWTVSGGETPVDNGDVKIENVVKLAAADDSAVSKNMPYAVCEFHLATPPGAEWRAALVGGNINAFEFVDAEGNVIAVPSGKVGQDAIIRIRAKQAEVSSNMEAYLDIVVVTKDGRTLGTVGALCNGYRQKITQIAIN